MSPYVTWRVHSAHGGKLKLVWVFTDRGNLEAESRTKWTVTNPGSSRAWSKAQNQDSFIELQPGQPMSACCRVSRSGTSHSNISDSACCLKLYALYKCTQKSPTNKQQTACVCRCFRICSWIYAMSMTAFLTLKQSHTSLFHRLASSIVLSDVFRCLQIATKGHGHSGNHEFCTSAWVGNVERSTNSSKTMDRSSAALKSLERSWTSWNNNLKGKQRGVCCAFQALPTKAAQQRFLPLPDPVSQNGFWSMSGGILRNPTCGRSGPTKREYFDGESWDSNQPANGN